MKRKQNQAAEEASRRRALEYSGVNSASLSSSRGLHDVSDMPTDVYPLQQNPGQVRQSQEDQWHHGHGRMTELGQVSSQS